MTVATPRNRARNQAPKKGWLTRLYTGTGAFDIVGKRRIWYIGFSLLMLICLLSIVFRGFNRGIDFTGGTQIQFPSASTSTPADVPAVTKVFHDSLGQDPESVQTVGTGTSASVLIKSRTLDAAQVVKLKTALFNAFHPADPGGASAQAAISDSAVSASWGGQITSQAVMALGVFLVLVTLFLALYFERSMAIAALVALLHDVLVTAGVYSIVGFEVTPATVIGLLTILGFSLYDTVVVFDKVKENTRGLLGLTRRTYPEAANLALNQTLMRSINTSLIAVLPVLGLHDRRRRPAGRRHARRPRARADGRHPRRRAVVAVAGDPAPGRPQDARPAVQGAGRAGRGAAAQGRRGAGRRRQGERRSRRRHRG